MDVFWLVGGVVWLQDGLTEWSDDGSTMVTRIMVKQWLSDGQITLVRRWLTLVNIFDGYKMVLFDSQMMDIPWLQRSWFDDGNQIVK